MSVLDRARDFVHPDGPNLSIPESAKKRMARGRMEKNKDSAKRKLCTRFERGETYWSISGKGNLVEQSTVYTGNEGSKPRHRIRNTYNFIRPIVDAKVSVATQKIPSYQILPTATDPDRVDAARLGEKVAIYGYDKWRLHKKSSRAIKLAIVQGQAFAIPYFDPNVGPFVPVVGEDGQMKVVGQGEIKILILTRSEVMWEPGVEFEESRWWATEHAENIDDVKDYPYYNGTPLKPDAKTNSEGETVGNLVMVTEYYERPSKSNPLGRHLCIANNKQIADPEEYPVKDSKGTVIDELFMHRLVWSEDTEDQDDLGLVYQLIDFQRSAQDCPNKLLEWKNRCLNPRIKAPVGSLLVPPDDEPGGVDWYNQVGGGTPEWEKPPAIPQELFQLWDAMITRMQAVAGDQNIVVGSNVAAATVQAAIQQAQMRWATFLDNVAEWHSHIMRHCLMLVAVHYSEPRLLALRGRFGPESIQAFRGDQLMDEVNVRVFPGSIEFQSRTDVMNRVMAFADRGWITPEAAMAAINGGTADQLINSYELDVARVNEIIQKIIDGSVWQLPQRPNVVPVTDPATGQAVLGPDGQPQMQDEPIPGWMPDEFDNETVWLSVLSDWMKTTQFQMLPPDRAEVARLMYKGIKQLEQQKAQRAMEIQTEQAQQLGLGNAALPAKQSPKPNMPAFDAGQSQAGTPPSGPQQ